MDTDLREVPTLDEIAREPRRAHGLTVHALVALATQCAAAQSAIALAQAALLLSGDDESAPDAASDNLLTVEQAAAMLAVSKPWLYRRAKRLGLAVKLGDGTLRFSSNVLQRFIRENRTSLIPARRRRKPAASAG